MRTDRKSTRLNSSHLVPYTTLFRSRHPQDRAGGGSSACALGSSMTVMRRTLPTLLTVLIALVVGGAAGAFFGHRAAPSTVVAPIPQTADDQGYEDRSEEHTSELQSLSSLHDALPISSSPRSRRWRIVGVRARVEHDGHATNPPHTPHRPHSPGRRRRRRRVLRSSSCALDRGGADTANRRRPGL